MHNNIEQPTAGNSTAPITITAAELKVFAAQVVIELLGQVKKEAKEQSNSNKLITELEAAKWLSVSMGTLRRWARHKYITSYKDGRRTCYYEGDIIRWLNTKTAGYTAPAPKKQQTL